MVRPIVRLIPDRRLATVEAGAINRRGVEGETELIIVGSRKEMFTAIMTLSDELENETPSVEALGVFATFKHSSSCIGITISLALFGFNWEDLMSLTHVIGVYIPALQV